jgi:hypothetical protein
MLGQVIRGGTAFSDVLYDETAAIRLKKDAPPPKTTILESQEELTQEQIDSKLYTSVTASFIPLQTALPAVDPSASIEEEDFDLDVVVE